MLCGFVKGAWHTSNKDVMNTRVGVILHVVCEGRCKSWLSVAE